MSERTKIPLNNRICCFCSLHQISSASGSIISIVIIKYLQAHFWESWDDLWNVMTPECNDLQISSIHNLFTVEKRKCIKWSNREMHNLKKKEKKMKLQRFFWIWWQKQEIDLKFLERNVDPLLSLIRCELGNSPGSYFPFHNITNVCRWWKVWTSAATFL